MMDIVQWGINIAMIAGVAFLWVKSRESANQKSNQQFSESLSKLEARIQSLETELNKQRDSFQEQLKEVEAIVEQANKVLKSIRHVGLQFPMTQEESELKETLYSATASTDEIPSVASLENTKIRLQKESQLDLKTLLRGQLS